MVRMLIIGTGDHAHGLAHLFSISNSNCGPSGNSLEVTKPSITKKGQLFHDTGVYLVPFDEGMASADVVILAIPANAVKRFVASNIAILKDKILVDTTNSSIPGEDLHSILAMTSLRWVKAFNDVGAVDVLLKKPESKTKFVTKMCSNNPAAVATLKLFAETSMGFDVKIVPYEHYHAISDHQNSLGEEWVISAYLMLVIFVLTEIYALMRYNVHKGYAWFHLPLQVTNKAICWTAITGFSLSQLPGVFARVSNAVYGNTLRTKPTWLVRFLAIRKHLGLVSLWFLGIHILMSMLLFNPGYYSKFFIKKDGTSKMNSIGENSFFFATLGTGLYFILGICSLPSVGSQMTNKQWQVVYGPVAWIALAFGTVHVLIMGVKGWDDQEGWPGNLPPITLTSTMIPLAVLFLKLLQMVFCRLVWLKRASFSPHRPEYSVGTPSSLVNGDTGSIATKESTPRSARDGALVSMPPLLEEKKLSRGPSPDTDDEDEDLFEYTVGAKDVYLTKRDLMRQMKDDIA